jgi:outer membrane lipoprotein SlyB
MRYASICPGPLALALIAALAATACAPVHSGSTYSRSQAGQEQRVSRGTILAMREVKVEGTDTGAGKIGGAVIGGAAGSTLGQGNRANVAGAAAGAVLGAVLGSMAESRITERPATEFTVREETGLTIAVVQANDENLREGERVMVLRGNQVRIVRDTLPAAGGAPRGS